MEGEALEHDLAYYFKEILGSRTVEPGIIFPEIGTARDLLEAIPVKNMVSDASVTIANTFTAGEVIDSLLIAAETYPERDYHAVVVPCLDISIEQSILNVALQIAENSEIEGLRHAARASQFATSDHNEFLKARKNLVGDSHPLDLHPDYADLIDSNTGEVQKILNSANRCTVDILSLNSKIAEASRPPNKLPGRPEPYSTGQEILEYLCAIIEKELVNSGKEDWEYLYILNSAYLTMLRIYEEMGVKTVQIENRADALIQTYEVVDKYRERLHVVGKTNLVLLDKLGISRSLDKSFRKSRKKT